MMPTETPPKSDFLSDEERKLLRRIARFRWAGALGWLLLSVGAFFVFSNVKDPGEEAPNPSLASHNERGMWATIALWTLALASQASGEARRFSRTSRDTGSARDVFDYLLRDLAAKSSRRAWLLLLPILILVCVILFLVCGFWLL